MQADAELMETHYGGAGGENRPPPVILDDWESILCSCECGAVVDLLRREEVADEEKAA